MTNWLEKQNGIRSRATMERSGLLGDELAFLVCSSIHEMSLFKWNCVAEKYSLSSESVDFSVQLEHDFQLQMQR